MNLLIDNYDSFTYNLYQYICEFDPNTIVYRNDKIDMDIINVMNPKKIIISPGPKTPKDAGNCIEIINEMYKRADILGICLGHQAICHAFGGKVDVTKNKVHGKASIIEHNEKEIFKGIPNNIRVGRYHSLSIQQLTDDFEITARSIDDKEIMGIKHRDYNVFGLQFHPESILSEYGKMMIKNFLNI